MDAKSLSSFLILFLFFLFPPGSRAQTDSLAIKDSIINPLEQKLSIGVFEQPPYIIKGENNTWDGISIRLWRAVAEDLDITYDFIEVPANAGNEVLQNGQTNILLLGNVTAEADVLMDFSHIYHSAQQGIVRPQTLNLGKIVKGFFNKRFWFTAGMLSILLLIVGTIIYFVERGGNKDQFGGDRNIGQGIGSGFWWAGVTMTTIGYGDKAPTTFLGRAIALIWMLIAMAVTAVLTASLVSTVMGSSSYKPVSLPDDLREMKVAAVKNSDAAKYLQEERVQFQSFSEVKPALQQLNKNDLDAVVHSVPVLRYTINNDPDLGLKVQPVNISPKFYAFGFASESKLREPVNQALLRVILTPLWQKELDRFIPDSNGK